MTQSDVTPTIVLRSGYEPGSIGRIGELHGRYYAAAWGSGAAFEIQMLRALCAFVEEYDPLTHVLLTAHAGGVLIGSAAVIRFQENRRAQLRWVIVDPAWQGRGAGRALLQAALDWCRERGVEICFLWTVEGLPASRTMYERAGFRLVERAEDARYTRPCSHGPRLLFGPPGLTGPPARRVLECRFGFRIPASMGRALMPALLAKVAELADAPA